jgi:multicomponent Na+:H+ antiporter subunit B
VRVTGALLVALFAGLLVYTTTALPDFGDADAPAHRTTSPAQTPVAGTHHMQHAYEDAETPNMVTVVLADYRSWDTFGEVVVVFAGGLACFFILRRRV